MNLDGQTCLGGALVYKADFAMIKDGPSPGGRACNLVEQAAQHLYNCDYVTVNDLIGYEAAMRVLDLAIRNSMEADNV